MAVNDPANIVVGRWQPTFNSAAIGYTDKCVVKKDKVLEEIKAAQTFDQVLGRRLMGVDVTIEVICKEVIKANLALAFPWWSGSGSIAFIPTVLGVDLYDYAHSLTMHPMWMGDTSLDHVFPKAVVVGGYELACDGKETTTLSLMFGTFPDRASFPSMVIGSLG